MATLGKTYDAVADLITATCEAIGTVDTGGHFSALRLSVERRGRDEVIGAFDWTRASQSVNACERAMREKFTTDPDKPGQLDAWALALDAVRDILRRGTTAGEIAHD